MVVGDTLMLAPVPTSVPPHEPLYHLMLAPVPRLPPLTLSVEELPEQMVDAEAEALVGAVEAVLTVTVVDTQPVIVPHGDGSS